MTILDIDHFKRLNDTFGHDVGDFVLQLVAELLRENVRKSDIVCRYGGEEMTVILPEANLDEAAARAETLRHALSQMNPRYQGQSLGMLTASLGMADFPDHGNTPEALIKAADTALYDAKASGRNQVLTAPTPPPWDRGEVSSPLVFRRHQSEFSTNSGGSSSPL